jgi:light-regulated signal transduction histidine kinase (bacteriophytochrome)
MMDGKDPPFGRADLSNCETEQIHLPGSIQPHGALLVLREPDLTVVQASADAARFLNLKGDLIGQPVPEPIAAGLRPLLSGSLRDFPQVIRCRLGSPAADFDGLAHRPGSGGVVVELERAGPSVDLSRHADRALQTILTAPTLRALADDAVTLFRDLTGFDRVMFYRFDDEGHGEVFAERRKPEIEPFLGNRYPVTDIPQIARRLYIRNRVRILVDVQDEQTPILPALSPISGEPLDMSSCFLRSMSPIHLQYLKNMGVAATLVASLVVGGKLWGLVSCHHYAKRFIHFEKRAVCELLAEAIATRLAALECFAQGQAELSVRRLEQRMIEAISREGDWRGALFDSAPALLQPVGATGAALLFEGQVLTIGDVPSTPRLREIGDWLDRRPPARLHATASLGLDEPAFAPLIPYASGVMAASVSRTPGEYLIWFRPERVRTVTWGGDPNKPFVIGSDPKDLSPRRSFAQWNQLVEATSDPWTRADMTAGRLIGATVTDVVLQFRSVRLLIARSQMDQVSRQVKRSDEPVLIADAQGGLLLANEAFERLAGPLGARLGTLQDFSAFLVDSDGAALSLQRLVQGHESWRGEISFRAGEGDAIPLLVRADPVFSAPNRVLGFVLLFIDMTEKKGAAAARRQFQEEVLTGAGEFKHRLSAKSNLLYRGLMSSIIENAQLAALEITDVEEPDRMAEMLESVRSSVARTAEVLEHLVWHAEPRGKS